MPPGMEPIAEGLSKMMDSWYHLVGDKMGQKVVDGFFAVNRTFDEHPWGQYVRGMIMKGVQVRQQAMGQLSAPVNNFKGLVRQDSNLALMHNYDTATLGQIHGSLPQGHPARQALDPLMAVPSNRGKTLDDIKRLHIDQANVAGRQAAFGPSESYLASIVQPMLTGTSTERTLAKSWMDTSSQIFRDTKPQYDAGKIIQASEMKINIAEQLNAQRKAQGLPPINIDIGPTYEPPMKGERKFQEFTLNNLAPWIAVVHTSDLMKLPANLSGATLWKTINTWDDLTIKSMVDRSGAFVHTVNSIYDNDFKYRTGMVGQVTGSPNAAAIVHKMWHQPAFNNLRMAQIALFGTAGYHASQEWAWQAFQGSRFAADNLRDVGIDVADVMRQHGQLTQAQIEAAVFHFTNNNIFIDNPLERSRASASSPWLRIALMLHGYATKEARLMARTLYKAARNNEYGKIAQWFGVVALLYPFTAAPLIKSLGYLLRTGDPKEAVKDYKSTYKHLLHPHGFGDFALTYLELGAHFSGFGTFWNIFHAAANRRLAINLLGAGPGAMLTPFEDLAIAAWDKLHGRDATPEFKKALRDALRYSIPVLGGPIQHWALPQKKGGFSRLRH